jgi:hypothetical protein
MSNSDTNNANLSISEILQGIMSKKSFENLREFVSFARNNSDILTAMERLGGSGENALTAALSEYAKHPWNSAEKGNDDAGKISQVIEPKKGEFSLN